MRAWREHRDLRVGGRILTYVDVRQLHSPGLRVAPRAEVETHYDLQLLQRGHLLEEPPGAQLDQLFGAFRHRGKRVRARAAAGVRRFAQIRVEPVRMRDRWGTVRLEAFSDGVFAIAATLLVLDIGVPASKFDD